MMTLIQCRTTGCSGPAWLESEMYSEWTWHCHCSLCRKTTAIPVREMGKALSHWYCEQTELMLVVVIDETGV